MREIVKSVSVTWVLNLFFIPNPWSPRFQRLSFYTQNQQWANQRSWGRPIGKIFGRRDVTKYLWGRETYQNIKKIWVIFIIFYFPRTNKRSCYIGKKDLFWDVPGTSWVTPSSLSHLLIYHLMYSLYKLSTMIFN